MNQRLLRLSIQAVFLHIVFVSCLRAEDWPTPRHDQRRSGVCRETIDASKLVLKWTWNSSLPPASAWPDAAKWDAYASLEGLQSMRNYDPVMHPIVAKQFVYLPSNSDDTVRCLRLADGSEVWSFTANAPVRIAPTFFENKVYFGSDDGRLYCVQSETGELLWQNQVADKVDAFINDGRICCTMPVRTGVLIDEKSRVAIVAAGLFPWQETFLSGLDLETGDVRWRQDLGTGWTLEGSMLLSQTHIVAPQGRSAPQLFQRDDGKPVGSLPGGGGSFVLLTEDAQVFHGPGNKAGWITATAPNAPRDEKGNIAKVASFDRGSAVVVDGRTAYLLDDQRIAAFDRESGEFRWVTPCGTSHELILVGDTLFVGGNDEVWAYACETGKPLWRSDVTGRVHGVAASAGHLLVATDGGQLHVFAEGQHSLPRPIVPVFNSGLPIPARNTATPITSTNPDGLMQRWVFHRDQLLDENLRTGAGLRSLAASGVDLKLSPNAFLTQVGEEQALLLDGKTDFDVVADFHEIDVPTTQLSVEAVVRIDKPLEWGGLVSITQDNGSYEKGWILGYRANKFGFAINGADGPDRLDWITDTRGLMETGRWYHVVATYDGSQSKLYVDGAMVASSDVPKGAIRYPEKAGFHIGAYKDDDEHFIATGMLNEVAVFNRACGADEVQRRFKAFAGKFPEPAVLATTESSEAETRPPTRGPVLKFVSPGKAEVTWGTAKPQATRLELIDGAGKVQVENASVPTTQHRVFISDLGVRSVSHYRILHAANGKEVRSQEYECDTHFDYTRPALPAAELTSNAMERTKRIQQLADRRDERGLALVWGCADEAMLAEAISRSMNLDTIAVDKDPHEVARARLRLLDAGIYGRPVCARVANEPSEMGLPKSIFDLIVADQDKLEVTTLASLARLVQPGGVLIVDLTTDLSALTESGFVVVGEDQEAGLCAVRAPRIQGSAGWTHMYGTPENSAYAGETLAGARGTNDVRVAWAGRPGPRYQSDRGNRKPSPLAAGGRLYLQGLYRTIALDAYNGTILWSLELPEVVRFNVPRDCSNWCVDESNVYISTEKRCLVVDGATGEILSEHDVLVPQSGSEDGAELEWGYVARQSNALIGTGVRADSAFTEFWGKENWYDSKDGEQAKKVCSELIFSLDPKTGQKRWSYEQGLIVNPTITISGDRIYFVECRSKELEAGKSRRLAGPEFWNHLSLVALDLRTGNRIWETEAKPMEGESAFYMAYSDGKLLLQSSQGGKFALYAIDATNGKGLWRGMYAWQADHHGKHLSRPAIVDGTIYLRPLTLKLEDGAVVSQTFPDGHQCGTYTCSKNALFLRAGSLAVWDRETAVATRWDRLRPDCWISTIPAEGMLLSPEGGGGCSCGGWIETSIGFSPKWDDL